MVYFYSVENLHLLLSDSQLLPRNLIDRMGMQHDRTTGVQMRPGNRAQHCPSPGKIHSYRWLPSKSALIFVSAIPCLMSRMKSAEQNGSTDTPGKKRGFSNAQPLQATIVNAGPAEARPEY